MAPSKSDLPQGTLDLLILKTLALGPLHGYAIAQRLQQVSRDVVIVQQGTLYPALHRLEKRGALKAEWKPRIPGATRSSTAHPRGPRTTRKETAGWHRLTEAVGFILKTEG